ncbi:cytochrome P450 [Pseudonocardia eucalypti]|uniref:Cytochrome P450 n=1 Tax=Pseudonocardia eucalypti TaxID=648755 RepID=A0ABP9RAJ2_9PSEU|nr:cytochrome P450 [Pseudonocardia eucalypti]
MTTATLPPGPTAPPFLQGVYALTRPLRGLPRLRAKYGDAFTVHLPIFGRVLVISDPVEIKQLFLSGSELVENVEPNLGRLLGPGSFFALTGDEHRAQRKLLVPPFHGRRLKAYERIIEEETERELAGWPEGREFATLPSMMRITLNAILRAVFGAERAGRARAQFGARGESSAERAGRARAQFGACGEGSAAGAEFDELRDLLPRMVTYASRLAVLPLPPRDLGRWSPWGRFLEMRRRYDDIISRLIDTADHDPRLDDRNDVLALLLQSRYEDGSRMSHSDIADQLLTLLAAGHETTATTMAWAVERLRRHPSVLAELVDEVDAGGHALREATILEVQRTRPVIDGVGRQVKADHLRIGRWTVPRGYNIVVAISLVHEDEAVFPDAKAFDPGRFVDAKPDLYQWIPFGGGTRRCIGAAFANMEMNVVLRTLLRDFRLLPTDAPDERWRSRGVANAPAKGGLIAVRRRSAPPVPAVSQAQQPPVGAVHPPAGGLTGGAPGFVESPDDQHPVHP